MEDLTRTVGKRERHMEDLTRTVGKKTDKDGLMEDQARTMGRMNEREGHSVTATHTLSGKQTFSSPYPFLLLVASSMS